MRQQAKIFLAALALSAFGIGFASSGAARAAEEERTVATAGADGVQRATILAGSYFFKPARIVVKVGAPVELTINKQPSFTPHNFTLQAAEAGIDVSEDLGASPTIVRFTPTKPGSYEFSCNKKPPIFKSHRSQGMVGTLDVEP
jgi:plastocyanin